MQAAGRIHQNNIHPTGDGGFYGIKGDGRRVGLVLVLDDVGTGPIGPDAQLFDRCRPKGVRRRNEDFLAVPAIACRKLADRRRFSDPVDPDDHDNFRPGRGITALAAGAASTMAIISSLRMALRSPGVAILDALREILIHQVHRGLHTNDQR